MKNLKDVFVGVELVDPIEPDPPDMPRDLWVVGEESSSRLDGFVGVLVDDRVDICCVGLILESFFLVYPSSQGWIASAFFVRIIPREDPGTLTAHHPSIFECRFH